MEGSRHFFRSNLTSKKYRGCPSCGSMGWLAFHWNIYEMDALPSPTPALMPAPLPTSAPTPALTTPPVFGRFTRFSSHAVGICKGRATLRTRCLPPSCSTAHNDACNNACCARFSCTPFHFHTQVATPVALALSYTRFQLHALSVHVLAGESHSIIILRLLSPAA